ncbi:hypothetical protein L208DRAFT_1421552 [Tricholoma matsutake]|nr:hypothetical protein L208DRAFT_1421552 [Tricholoma matsutake 945]
MKLWMMTMRDLWMAYMNKLRALTLISDKLIDTSDISDWVLQVLDLMDELHLNLPLFLWAISWNVLELTSNNCVCFARMALMVSDELPGILAHWHRPPRSHGQGIWTKAARKALNDWALDTLCETLDDELSILKLTMLSQQHLSEEVLLAISWKEMILEIKSLAPTLWKLFRYTLYTPMQEERNKMKDPDVATLLMISMASFSCSHHHCKLAKLLMVYFKSSGLATKAFDTLHALGITMSQKWAYHAIKLLSKQIHVTLLDDIKCYPWFGCHDNINLPFKVYEQRLSNQSHFDSGTAATILRVLGTANPIAYKDVVKLEHDASPHLKAYAVHQVLMYLTAAPNFSFKTYTGKKHSLFNSCPIEELPIGPEHVTLHIEEASYEGNDCILSEWWCQLKLDMLDKQKETGKEKVIIWVGNQLTEVFRWFHLQIVFEHLLHPQYYGTQRGFGLVHAFDLLKCKGLQSPTAHFHDLWGIIGEVDKLADLCSCTPEQLHVLAVKIVDNHASMAALQKMAAKKLRKDKLLYQSTQMACDLLDYVNFDVAIKTGDVGYLQDLLPHLLFWFIGGKNKNYAIEILELLQGLHREWPPDLRNYIIKYCWLANMTGRQDGFLPIDLLQEHNVRNIKYTFAAKGPYVDWDYIGKIDLNHFLHGKSHSLPEKDEDITRLCMSYRASKIHSNHSRQKLDSKDRVVDTMSIGTESGKLLKAISKWVANWVSEWSREEDWKEY